MTSWRERLSRSGSPAPARPEHPGGDPRRLAWGWPEVAVFGFALALRLVIVSHATWQPVGDTRDYHAFAESLLSGRGYQQRYAGETAAYHGLTFHAYRMPGYPVFLALVYGLFGWRPLYAYLANVLCDLVTAVFTLLIGRRLGGRGIGLAAQALFALHVIWTPALMTESLFTALFAGLVFLVVSGRVAASATAALGFGGVLAASLFVRPIALTVVPVALARIVRTRGLGGAALLGVLALAPSALALAGWAVRNHARLGEVVLFSTNLGLHNSREFPIDRALIVRAAVSRGLNEAQINRLLLGEIGQAVRRAPGRAAGIYLRRVVEVFSPRRPRTHLWSRAFEGPGGSRLVTRLYRGLALQYLVTYPLALVGTAVLVRRGCFFGGLWSLIGSFALVHALVSNGNLRFAAPLYPLVCVLAGCGIAGLVAGGVRCARRRAGGIMRAL
ncbi:MAG TPA: hypothetical protein VJB36_06645 [Methylomirabilota bacterium]|nr:hypothetical protein [Methylomirabilota bacterium]